MIPAQIRYNSELPAAAKILYAEISSLTDTRGYCFASNAYFMDLYGMSEATLQRHLRALKSGGFIRIQDGDGGSGRRKIFAGINPLAENPIKNDGVSENPIKNDGVTPSKMTGSLKSNNKKDEQIPLKPPRGRAAKAAPDYEPEIFARFWTAYPIGRDKQGAIREWDKLKPSRQLMQTMAAALAEQKKTLSAEDPHDRYPFPYAIRWIRDRRWEDDLQKSTQRAAKSEPHAGRSVDAPEVAQW